MKNDSDLLDRSQIENHLNLLYGQACEEHGAYFSIFTLMNRQTLWFNEISEAVEHCAQSALSGQHVYGCMGLFKEPVLIGRGTASDIIGITGLWVDVDIESAAAHKGKNYPPDLDSALNLCRVGGFSPGYYVHSGYGIHAYWPFDEPLMFENSGHKQDTAILVNRWQSSIRAEASAKGWDVDSTHDFARVLRIAGTINYKDPESPKPVVLCIDDTKRMPTYDLDSMEESMIAVEYVTSGSGYRALAPVQLFKIDPNERLDPKVLAVACSNSSDFEATWHRKREDFVDQSASVYDFSLANHFVRMGFTDQDIVTGLVQWRIMHGEDIKNRVDYYQRTIGKIRATVQQSETLIAVEQTTHELPEVTDVTMLSRKDKVRYIKDIQAMLRIEIVRFIQVNLDNANYFFELKSGERFCVGGVHYIVEPRLFRERIAERLGVLLDNSEITKKWPLITKLLFAIREYEDTDESTTADVCHALAVEYLDSSKWYSEEEWPRALTASHPFQRSGNVFINVGAFTTWARMNKGVRMTDKDVVRDFKLLGMESARIEGRDRGERKNRTYWSSPSQNWPEIFTFGEPGKGV